MGGGEGPRWPVKHYYLDQGGWNGWKWGGVHRSCFIFSDSLQAGGTLCVSQGEGLIKGQGLNKVLDPNNAPWLAETLPNKYFAGIVCVAD